MSCQFSSVLGVDTVDNPEELKDSAFQRVIGYFLDHEKPKDESEKKPAKPRKKPSTKAKKRA